MYILGYSGLHHSLLFRKNNIQGLMAAEEKMCQGMDSAAVLLHDGQLIAAVEEERFNLDKHTYDFPVNSINFCLKEAGITLNEVDYICHGFNFDEYRLLFEMDGFSRNYYEQILSANAQKQLFKSHYNLEVENKFISIPHHEAHAASCYYPSYFDDALIIVADGMGEVDSISIYQGSKNILTKLKNYNVFSSLGIFYSLITLHLGFEINSGEYKTMGLAPYGDPLRYKAFFDSCVVIKDNGEVYLPIFSKNKTFLDTQTYRTLREWITEQTFPPREKSSEITQAHRDLAAGLQHMLNQSMLAIASYWQKKTGATKLCMAGGVALNCVTNSLLLKSHLFEDIYVQPAAGDAGTALGAALYKYCCMDNQFYGKNNNKLPFYGPAYNRTEVLQTLQNYHDTISFREVSENEKIELAAKMIEEGKIIAWMQGGMEFGPRALGNRSILADPRCVDMKEKINKSVKMRELFRPFAPSVKLEKAPIFFDIDPNQEFPFMLFTMDVKEKYRAILPAITHEDGSSRVQTVSKDDHPLYWKLLNEFEKLSGIPILLNTSFNVNGRPMVCSPDDAIQVLLLTNIDCVFIENFIVMKKEMNHTRSGEI